MQISASLFRHRLRTRIPALVGWLLLASSALARQPPELRFEAPETLTPQVERLERIDRARLLSVMTLLGLEDPGPPIRVVLATEGTPAARRAPSWAVAYAVGGAGLVVLIPSRVPGYPDHSIESVLLHEVAHVLITRAAGHRPVPRWFNEGLAIYAAREWRFGDRARVAVATVRRRGVALAEIERRFQAGAHSAASAYALSTAFVRFLIDRHGFFVAARIFDDLAAGHPFPQAFRRATGATVAMEEELFWRHLDLWNKWIPFLTSSATLWMVITGLALWAFRRRRERDAEQVALWEEEERRHRAAVEAEQMSPGSWVH